MGAGRVCFLGTEPTPGLWRLKVVSGVETEELGFPRGEQSSLGARGQVLGLLGSVKSVEDRK